MNAPTGESGAVISSTTTSERDTDAASGGRGSRRALLGVADQVVSSATNYLTAFVASLVLVPERFGAFVVAYAVVTVASAGARAVLSEPLIAHLPSVASPGHRRLLAGSAMGAATLFGLVGTVLMLALGLAGGSLLGTLVVFVPWVLGAFVADAGRYVLLSRLRTGATLAVDLAWAFAQGAVLLVVGTTGTWTPAAIAASWGTGALAGVVVLVVVGVERPGRPGSWLREGRYLSGWFTVVSVLGQVQMYAVLLLAGAVVSAVDMAGLRAVQLLVFQPPTTFAAAVLVLATPMFARTAPVPGTTTGRAARRLPPQFRRIRTAAVVAMGALGLVVLAEIPLRGLLLTGLFPRYTEFDGLVAPIAIQVALLCLAVPFAASLRGMRRARLLFGVQLLTTTTMLAGAALGLAVGGVAGLAWGMATAAALVLAAEVTIASRARPLPAVGVPSPRSAP